MFGELGPVGVFGTCVDFEAGHLVFSELIFGEHAGHGQFNRPLRLLLEEPVVSGDAGSARIARVPEVRFGLPLFSGEDDIPRVDNHHEVPAVRLMGVIALPFALEKVGGLDGKPTQHLATGVQEAPFADDIFKFGPVCFG